VYKSLVSRHTRSKGIVPMRGENNGRWMTWWCVDGKRLMGETVTGVNVPIGEPLPAGAGTGATDCHAIFPELPSSGGQRMWWETCDDE
jgi:hypothetical protein